jgi:hypothetical protein
MTDGNTPITITLELQKLSVIVSALQELPYRVSSELIMEIQEKVGEFLKGSETDTTVE